MAPTKKVVIHKRGQTATNNTGRTACGIDLYGVAKSNKTWRGVTCKRCLVAKNKKGRLNQRVAKAVKATTNYWEGSNEW